MSTRCRIGVELPDGKIKSIYCHHDGYISGVGKVLHDHYDSNELAEQLIELGDISSLGETYDQEMSKLDWRRFDADLTDEEKKKIDLIRGFAYTITYKDRGEEGIEARIDNSIEEFINSTKMCGGEYAYLYRFGNWEVLPLYFQSVDYILGDK